MTNAAAPAPRSAAARTRKIKTALAAAGLVDLRIVSMQIRDGYAVDVHGAFGDDADRAVEVLDGMGWGDQSAQIMGGGWVSWFVPATAWA
jgi:hypothetical protein